MEFITQLWMPIVLSAVLVFIASAVLWMATPLHKKDYSTPPDESVILNALRSVPFPPGMYFMPWCRGGKEMKDAQVQARMKEGPWALMIIPNGAPSFGRSLFQWFVTLLVISVFVAYLAHATIKMGDGAPDYLHVFRVVGAAAFLAQAGMASHDSIWKGAPWRQAAVKVFDGLVYALVTAGVFGWLWPRG